MYNVPLDVMLLSAVLAGMFRATSSPGRTSRTLPSSPCRLPLTFYVPNRDGELNDAMVGLFSDWRDCTIPCGEYCTVLGLCYDVADIIRHRKWTVFNPLENYERILVNTLPLDEVGRGSQLFRQTRAHEYRDRKLGPPRERSAYRGRHRPMRITLEQESCDIWWISLDVNGDHYSPEWCRHFARELRRTLEDFALRPLDAVLNFD